MTTAIPGIGDDRNGRRRRRWWCGGGRALLIYAFLSEVIVVLQDKRVRSRSQEIRAKGGTSACVTCQGCAWIKCNRMKVGSRGTRGVCPF